MSRYELEYLAARFGYDKEDAEKMSLDDLYGMLDSNGSDDAVGLSEMPDRL